MRIFSTVAIILSIIFLTGCNLPVQGGPTEIPGLAYTQSARTVEAELTRVAGLVSPTPNLPTATFTPVPTNTLQATATNTPIPENKALFITDVTIPDNTVVPAGSTFTKTWRLRNVGTRTWNSSYQLVFESGDAMGVPTGYAQALTSGFVSPGQDVDATVNLTAPMATGTYQGRWGFREPTNQTIFTHFIVVIKVPAATSHSVTTSSSFTPGEIGTVRGDGHTAIDLYVGDFGSGGSAPPNLGLQTFVAFDITGIPNNATITEVKMDLSDYTISGDPFGNLGCIKVYPVNYDAPPSPSAGDFISGPAPANEDHDWCSTTDLGTPAADNDFRKDLQAKVGTGRIRYRVQFNSQTNSDNNADVVQFTKIDLIITYTTP